MVDNMTSKKQYAKILMESNGTDVPCIIVDLCIWPDEINCFKANL